MKSTHRLMRYLSRQIFSVVCACERPHAIRSICRSRHSAGERDRDARVAYPMGRARVDEHDRAARLRAFFRLTKNAEQTAVAGDHGRIAYPIGDEDRTSGWLASRSRHSRFSRLSHAQPVVRPHTLHKRTLIFPPSQALLRHRYSPMFDVQPRAFSLPSQIGHVAVSCMGRALGMYLHAQSSRRPRPGIALGRSPHVSGAPDRGIGRQ